MPGRLRRKVLYRAVLTIIVVSALAARLRTALLPVGTLLAVLVAGIAGFVLLAGVGVVEAAFWLLDPTSLELHFRTHEGPERLTKAFALVVFGGLLLVGIWTGETVLNAAFGGRVREELERMQRERRIEELSDHVVVCGYGMFGRTVTERLTDAGEDVVVVERDERQLDAVPDGAVPYVGDARRESVLGGAGIERARAVVAAVDDSNVNVQTAIVGAQLGPSVRLVVRIGDERYESLARRAGADEVVIPEVLSGDTVSDLL
jgi:voltage-gated potassium channel